MAACANRSTTNDTLQSACTHYGSPKLDIFSLNLVNAAMHFKSLYRKIYNRQSSRRKKPPPEGSGLSERKMAPGFSPADGER